MTTANYGPLTPNGYLPRLIEARLQTLMQAFGCVEIAGAKWCGKTWTALTMAESVTRMDRLPEREAAETDPALALLGETPHLVDEWQEVPEIWDAARRYVDDSGNRRGQLILTGSTSLGTDGKKRVRHSGTGRIGRLLMRPMSLYEMGLSTGAVRLGALFDGQDIVPSRTETSIGDVAAWCCRGGWPANIGLPDELASETAVQYLQTSLSGNVEDEGRSIRTAQNVMRALAMGLGSTVTNSTLAQDVADGEQDTPSVPTILSYIEMLERFFVVEEVPGWEPPMRAKARIRVKPKRYFVDPSLPAALLSATPPKLLADTQTLGNLFENLVLRDLSVYLSTFGDLGNSISYYRDEKGLEVDFIVEHAGKWGALEVKLSDSKADKAAESLLRLKRKVTANPAARNAEPAFLAVIVGKGALSYRRPDGVYVIPIASLAP